MKTTDSDKSIDSHRVGRVGAPGGAERSRMKSHELFGARREILIEHAGSEYRLRITSNDKLILTK